MSDEVKLKQSLAHKGKICSEETKEKMKGRTPWNKGISWDDQSISDKQKEAFDRTGKEPHNKGKSASEETRRKQSEAAKGRVPWNKGKINCYSKETCKKISDANIGRHIKWSHPMSDDQKDLISKNNKKRTNWYWTGKKRDEETCRKVSESNKGRVAWNKGMKMDDAFREQCRQIMESKWKDVTYAHSQMKAMHDFPNKPERKLLELLDTYYPGEWKYVGDGQVVIDGKIPDFINVNGQKKIIEMFGDYWHRNDDTEQRTAFFKDFGYDTLVIWESELKDRRVALKKIAVFAAK